MAKTIFDSYLLLCDLLAGYAIIGFAYFLWPQRDFWAFKPWIFKLAVMWVAVSFIVIGDFLRLVNFQEMEWAYTYPFSSLIYRTLMMIALFVGYRWLRREAKVRGVDDLSQRPVVPTNNGSSD